MFEVIVSNIGTVHTGTKYMDAIDEYAMYATQSLNGKGLAAYETVTLMRDDEILLEFTEEKDKEE